MRPSCYAAAAASALALVAASASHAAYVTGTSGTVYLSTPTDSVDTGISGPGDAMFMPGAIDYNPSDDSSVYTIGPFLNNPTFTGQSAAFIAAGGPNTSFYYGTGNTQINITGTVMLNHGSNSFVVGHDDGVVLNIAGFGNVVDAPSPTALDTNSFNVNNPGAAGTFAFTLDYVEADGPPAALVFAVNGVPEPATWGLMLLGLGLVGAAARRKGRLSAV